MIGRRPSEARRFKLSLRLLASGIVLLLNVFHSPALATQVNGGSEQRRFGIDVHVKKPTTIPEEVLRNLRTDERARACLQEGQDANSVDASWFVASVIHLGANNVDDLIVMPQNACLLGANIGPFWVYRKTPTGFGLVLVTNALGLEVLSTRTRGLRDIHASSATATKVSTKTFSFNGSRYQRRSAPPR